MFSHKMINYFEYCYNTDPITINGYLVMFGKTVANETSAYMTSGYGYMRKT